MTDKLEWERTSDEVIDLTDLLRRMFGNLKWMVLCGAVFAVLLGAYKYNEYLHPVVEDYVKQAKTVKLTSAEEQAVRNVENLMDNILRVQDYMDNSVYININPHHVNTVTMLFGVSNANKNVKRQVIESYLSYINNGGVVQYLQEENSLYADIGEAYLLELISASKSITEAQEQILVLEDTDASSWFYVQVLGEDMDKAGKLADQIQKALEKFSSDVEEQTGSHQFHMITRQETECYDRQLESNLNDYNTRLSDSKYRIETLTTNFSSAQNTVYNAYLQRKGLVIKVEDAVTISQVVLFAIIGIIIGVFIYCCAYAFFYMYSGTVKSVRELERKYIFHIFGTICLRGKKEPQNEVNDQEKLALKIELLVKDREVSTVGILPTDILSEGAGKQLKKLQDLLEKRGIDSLVIEDVCDKPEQWKEMQQIGHAIPVFDMGHTTHREINEEMSFCRENKIQVLGTIAIER